MALPSSGPLTLTDIQTEFGGSNPIGLNEYYAGGSYVPSGTTGTYGAVPSSGTIDINVFHGTSKAIPWANNSSYTTAFGSSYSAYAIVRSSTQFVAVGSNGVAGGARCVTSSDGVTWTYRSGFATIWTTTKIPLTIAFGNSVYVAISGTNGTACATSPDGITWTLRAGFTPTFGSGGIVYSVVYATGSTFFCMGQFMGFAKTAVSTNSGATWSTTASNCTNFLTAWDNNSGTKPNPRASYNTGSLILAVGDSCVTSSDNTATWTLRAGLMTAFSNNIAYAIAWSGSKFVVVGGGGKCATSTDGITWTLQSSFATAFGTSAIPYSATWTGSKYIVAGGSGLCVSSTDGITWSAESSFTTAFGASNTAYGATYGNSKAVVVGSLGAIATQ